MKSYESVDSVADRSTARAAATIPIVCPACQSPAISTTSRNPDDNAYWRCTGCGEVWNASRRNVPGKQGTGRGGLA